MKLTKTQLRGMINKCLNENSFDAGGEILDEISTNLELALSSLKKAKFEAGQIELDDVVENFTSKIYDIETSIRLLLKEIHTSESE